MNRRLLLGILSGTASAGAGNVQITDQFIADVDAQPSVPANASYRLLANGLAYRAVNWTGPVVIPGEWTSPTEPVGADYEVFAELAFGDLYGPASSATGQWLSLGTDRQWWVQADNVALVGAELRITIRDVNTLQEVGSAYITLQARMLAI